MHRRAPPPRSSSLARARTCTQERARAHRSLRRSWRRDALRTRGPGLGLFLTPVMPWLSWMGGTPAFPQGKSRHAPLGAAELLFAPHWAQRVPANSGAAGTAPSPSYIGLGCVCVLILSEILQLKPELFFPKRHLKMLRKTDLSWGSRMVLWAGPLLAHPCLHKAHLGFFSSIP